MRAQSSWQLDPVNYPPGLGTGEHPDVAPKTGRIISEPFLPFLEAWKLQKILLQERIADEIPDTLILTQHESVITLGRRTRPEHWESNRADLQAKGINLFHIERGGSVTYHGPGQIVGYPILRMRNFCPGPKLYVHQLEEMLIRTLREWNIFAFRHESYRGVWVERHGSGMEKIASIGVRVVRGVTMHGFALNVNVDLQPFSLITPCGIEGCRVTSMAEILSKPASLAEVQHTIIRQFSLVFGLPFLSS